MAEQKSALRRFLDWELVQELKLYEQVVPVEIRIADQFETYRIIRNSHRMADLTGSQYEITTENILKQRIVKYMQEFQPGLSEIEALLKIQQLEAEKLNLHRK